MVSERRVVVSLCPPATSFLVGEALVLWEAVEWCDMVEYVGVPCVVVYIFGDVDMLVHVAVKFCVDFLCVVLNPFRRGRCGGMRGW